MKRIALLGMLCLIVSTVYSAGQPPLNVGQTQGNWKVIGARDIGQGGGSYLAQTIISSMTAGFGDVDYLVKNTGSTSVFLTSSTICSTSTASGGTHYSIDPQGLINMGWELAPGASIAIGGMDRSALYGRTPPQTSSNTIAIWRNTDLLPGVYIHGQTKR